MSQITFSINGIQYQVDCKLAPDVSLNEYIRTVAQLPGTKYMCLEGGCGACIVAVRASIPPNSESRVFVVNSCLVSILSCQDWEITTVEGIGNKLKGYHIIQKRLANFNGTQCGYCTPGWIMNMYRLLETKGNMTIQEIEDSFSGNLCRCTGYRPIIDAWKTFAIDCDEKLLEKLVDLEDLDTLKTCGINCSDVCPHKSNDDDSEGWCMVNKVHDEMIVIDFGTHKWYKVYNLYEVFRAMASGNYKIIAGNTGQGVYPETNLPLNLIDIFNVAQLKGSTMDVNLILGAGMTLSDMMELFIMKSEESEDFFYLKEMYDHMNLVAHEPVRFIGTIGGNLYLKYLYNEFPSDLFVIFEAVGAMITIAEENKVKTMTLPQFLKTKMDRRIIHSIMLPPLSKRYCSLRTFKIMPRAQNAHAIVNAGFLLKMDSKTLKIAQARIVYGNISKDFIHAYKTEKILVGKDPYSDVTLQLALQTLNKEILAEELPPEPSAGFRKMLAISLFYKAILSLCPESIVDPIFRSGGQTMKRLTSKGTQVFDTDKSVWPLNKPIPKIEGLIQCSGEATFVNDIPPMKGELHAQFVTADVPPGSIIEGFDFSEALKVSGVVAMYSAKDIPGDNSITPKKIPLVNADEEFLCQKQVKFFGQPAAIIVADREKTANKAAHLVKIIYKSISTKRPLLTVADVLNSNESQTRIQKDRVLEPTERGEKVDRVIKGEFLMGSQFHFTMEPQTCLVIPTEEGMDVHCATQFPDFANIAIANCLNISANKVNVIVRRVGGAFGSKISRSVFLACAAALVSYKNNKPCRFVLPLQTNMKIMGKRPPLHSIYEVGVDKEGEIQYLQIGMYSDSGCSFNENMTVGMVEFFKNCYDFKRWHVEACSVLTDTPSNTYCRCPFTTEGVSMIENIMEHIAQELQIDPMDVRKKNFSNDDNILSMIEKFENDSEYEERRAKIECFNMENRWTKRGLKMIPLSYVLNLLLPWKVIVSINHGDGTVTITHGGIEMGQGLNTKAIQVCGYALGIPIEMINIKPTSTDTLPNNFVTGGSCASELVSFSTLKACEILNERLEPIKKGMGKEFSWDVCIQTAYLQGIDLVASYFIGSPGEVQSYKIYAVCAVEVEIDTLTGNHNILRADILEDVGRSLSPIIDVGQIEGAIMMGFGLWTSEELVRDKSNGKLLTDRTWTYKIPGLKDIPTDFRVSFRRRGENKLGVLQSKATGEPATSTATVIIHSIKEAVRSARLDAGYEDKWIKIENPCTVEKIYQAVGHKIEHFRLKKRSE